MNLKSKYIGYCLALGLIALISLCCSTSTDTSDTFYLPKVFSNHMVLQRDKPIHFYGKGESGREVQVKFAGDLQITQVNSEGRWRILFPKMDEGGPFDLSINHGDTSVLIQDIHIGEVWLAGGQSNMQYTLDMLGQTATIDIDSQQNLRFFNVEIDWDIAPGDDVKGGNWQIATNNNIGSLSAVAYHFATTLQDSLGVPVGIISSNLGATSIETWMSREALLEFPQFDSIVTATLNNKRTKSEVETTLKPIKDSIEQQYFATDPGMMEEWYQPGMDRSGWDTVAVPFVSAWASEDLKDHKGVLWLSRKVAGWSMRFGDEAYLALNQIADVDKVWVNGVEIGSTWGGRIWRRYTVPNHAIKSDSNEIVIRLYGHTDISGLYTSAFWGNDQLVGPWRYKKGKATTIENWHSLFLPNASIFTHPGILYNANIAPLTSYPIRGVIWYQGESNEDRGREYRELLPALTKDWSKAWKEQNLPFYIVQLAAYRNEDLSPNKHSRWAVIREAQHKSSKRENSGIASAIDVGDSIDIHPPDKKSVGRRLAWSVLHNTFSDPSSPVSPEFKNIDFSGAEARIYIQGDRLDIEKGQELDGFIIAGPDQVFYTAKAIYDGQHIVVKSQNVSRASAVRYAWADNPGTNLIKSIKGLPLLPFRTDDWPLENDSSTFQWDPIGF